MVFTKLLLQNTPAIRPYNYEAASEPLLPKVAHCIPVLSSRYIGKCSARVLKRSGDTSNVNNIYIFGPVLYGLSNGDIHFPIQGISFFSIISVTGARRVLVDL